MAEMMKGGAGSPIDNENMKKWLSFYKAQSGGGGAAAGGIPINNISLGNANTAMKQYMEDTQIDAPKIDYEYNPFVPPESSDGDDDTKDDDDDFTESGPAVPPKPGEPGYVEYMMYEAGPDNNPHDNPYSVNDMIAHGTYTQAANLYDDLSGIPGVVGSGFGSIADNMNANIDAYYDGVGDAAPSQDNPDGSTSAPSGATAGDWGYFTYGGRDAARIAKNEKDWKKGSPLAESKKMTLEQKRRDNVNIADDRKKGTFTELLKTFAFGKATGANTGKRGGCPCGTPGCPGCGKGYNNGGRPSTIFKWPSLGEGYLDAIPVRPRYTSKFAPAELQEPVGDPTKHFSFDRVDREYFARADANPSMWKNNPMPGYDYPGSQGPSVIRIPSGERTSKYMPAELQSPVGEGVLKQTGPLSIKDQIAIRESEAKIYRENMKAKADVYNKIKDDKKGPLQPEFYGAPAIGTKQQGE